MKAVEYSRFLDKIMETDFETVSLSYAFSLKLEYLFLCSNLSLFEFSLTVNLNYSYLNDLLRGRKHISLNKLECVASGLQVNIVDLFDFTPLIIMKEEQCFIKYPIFETMF